MQEQFKVEGMSCQHCVRAVREAIEELDAHAAPQIDLAGGSVAVDSEVPRETLRQAIEAAGYKAT